MAKRNISTEMFDELFNLGEAQLLELYEKDEDSYRRDSASALLLGRIRTGLRKEPFINEDQLPKELAQELLESLNLEDG